MEENEICLHIAKFNKSKMIHKANFIKFECEECSKINSWWVHLRICQIYGKMLCCN